MGMASSYYADSTWGYWTSTNNSTDNSTVTSTDNTWSYWVNDNTTSATATSPTYKIKVNTANTWQYWTSNTLTYEVRPVKEDKAAIAARLRAEKQAKLEAEKWARERERANKKAWTLFRKALSAKQLEQFEKNKCIDVDGQSGKKYQIETMNFAQNIYELDDKGKRIRRICAHIQHSENCPIGDHLLAQKLYLEMAEEDFLRTANKRELN